MNDYAIRVEHLSKKYLIGGRPKYRMLRETVSDFIKRQASHKGSGGDENPIVWALKDVSFEVQPGESIGVIGANGAGKTTLLKVLTRVTTPTSGRARLRGRVGSLLEVGTGFHPELTGRENVYLNGAILGMHKAEIDARFDEIVAFSETERFIDTPVKHFSDGMRLRLAFSVAAHLEPEILLIDEVLAVGDLAFQNKCLTKMGDVTRHGRTVLFVSHSMAAVRALCKRAILLRKGQLAAEGRAEEVIQSYIAANNAGVESEELAVEPGLPAQVVRASVQSGGADGAPVIAHDQSLVVHARVLVSSLVPQTYVSLIVYNDRMEKVLQVNDFEYDESFLQPRRPGKYDLTISLPPNLLVPGHYTLGFEITRKRLRSSLVLSRVDHIAPFDVFDNGSLLAKTNIPWQGIVHTPAAWTETPLDMPEGSDSTTTGEALR